MKKTQILYWTFTGLFSAMMLFSGVSNFLVTPDSVALFDTLGYPNYLIPFIGLAKILGVIAILIPGLPRLKEWAYAGLFFDLLGATYSVVMVEGVQPITATMLIFFGLEALSYIYYNKRQVQRSRTATEASAVAV